MSDQQRASFSLQDIDRGIDIIEYPLLQNDVCRAGESIVIEQPSTSGGLCSGSFSRTSVSDILLSTDDREDEEYRGIATIWPMRDVLFWSGNTSQYIDVRNRIFCAMDHESEVLECNRFMYLFTEPDTDETYKGYICCMKCIHKVQYFMHSYAEIFYEYHHAHLYRHIHCCFCSKFYLNINCDLDFIAGSREFSTRQILCKTKMLTSINL